METVSCFAVAGFLRKLIEALDYVPCTTPLNMTITLDQRNPISLHPLDLTAEPSDQANAQYCIGLIQADDKGLASVQSAVDIILGVPFMRNAYTVLTYDVPFANGSFPNDTSTGSSSDPAHLRVGLLGLTDPTIALSEFNTVRVLNQPLPSTTGGGTNQNSGGAQATVGGHKMPVGIAVLIGLASFFGLCVALFALRFFITRKKWAKVARNEETSSDSGKDERDAYALTTLASTNEYDPSEGTLRTTHSNESKLASKDHARWTISTGRTAVEEAASGEFGQRISKREHRDSHNVNDPWDPRNYSMAFRDSVFEPEDITVRPPSPTLDPPFRRPDHTRTTSELRDRAHSVMMPLLAHTRSDSRMDDLAGVGLATMIGVGTAARGSKIDEDFRQSVVSANSGPRARSVSPAGTLRRSVTSPTQDAFDDTLSPRRRSATSPTSGSFQFEDTHSPPTLHPPLEEGEEK
ncbi:hypothetical protein HWV62_4215 [Athelia sp. TMB]|nr:hypothetical protein HWV62_4215 [Athelia sp. TMB]